MVPMIQVVLFEDSRVSDISPLTDLTPMQEIVAGGVKQFERMDRWLGTRTRWLVRDGYEEKVPKERRPDFGDPAILLNARLVSSEVLSKVRGLEPDEALVREGQVVAARVRSLDYEVGRAVFDGDAGSFKVRPCDAHLLTSPWDVSPTSLIIHLAKDLMEFFRPASRSVPGEIKVLGNHPVSLPEELDLLGPVTVDAREGPVVIGEGVQIEPYAYLKGPLYIGPHTVIVTGSRVAGSYIGVHGRIGGEVTTSIVSDYSNKYHLGFLGHSYVGRWVNIGAGSITSNLKNTYGEIKVGGVPTGLNKVGAFIGDHAKLSIGTLTYAGVRVGPASHLHGLVHEDVPPFTIYAKSLGWGLYELDPESAIRTYRRMAPRRGVDPDPAEEQLLRRLFYETEHLRRSKGVKKGRLVVR